MVASIEVLSAKALSIFFCEGDAFLRTPYSPADGFTCRDSFGQNTAATSASCTLLENAGQCGILLALRPSHVLVSHALSSTEGHFSPFSRVSKHAHFFNF